MQAVKSSGSVIENRLAKAMWAAGIRYRRNNSNIYGRPDFTLRTAKIAIFADSEFWHGKNWEDKKHEHKSNITFWHRKIEANIERDRLVNQILRKNGWLVLRFWGNDIEKDVNHCVELVLKRLNDRNKRSIAL